MSGDALTIVSVVGKGCERELVLSKYQRRENASREQECKQRAEGRKFWWLEVRVVKSSSL